VTMGRWTQTSDLYWASPHWTGRKDQPLSPPGNARLWRHSLESMETTLMQWLGTAS
jgi:hypothetical protein